MNSFNDFALTDTISERLRRQDSASSAECTPIHIDVKKQTGIFSGISGEYSTQLTECECMDFKRRNRPCKHMYRLAYELGVYTLDKVISDTSRIKKKITPAERENALNRCIALFETYEENTQRMLHSILSCRHGGRLYVCEDVSPLQRPLCDGLLETVISPETVVERFSQKRTVDGMIDVGFSFPSDLKPTKKVRYEWCLSHADIACAYVYPEFCVIRPAGDLEVAYMKAYSYFNRKFEDTWEEYLNEE